MAKYYKVIVTTTYYSERIVKADSLEEVENESDKIVNSIDLMDDVPEVNTEIEERPDMDDDDVEIDLTKSFWKWWGSDAEYDLAKDLEDFYEEKFGKSAVYWEDFDNPKGFSDVLEGRPDTYSTGGYTSDYEEWGQNAVTEAVKNGCDTPDDAHEFITGKKY